MKLKYKCGCMSDSPFMWRHDPRPSTFMSDPYFRTNAMSGSVASTKRVEEARAKGEPAGYMYGISKNREAEILRMRNFSVYSIATTTTKRNVPKVRHESTSPRDTADK